MYKISEHIIEQIRRKLEQAKKICIIGHSAPDADAVSSVLALYTYFSRHLHGVTVTPVLPDQLPNYVLWMDNIDKILIGDQAAACIKTADIIFCLDFNELKRSGDLQQIIGSSAAFKVVIDHHPDPENMADVIISFPQAGSTAEIVYSFLVQLADHSLIDKDIATYIFTGILTDTGCFCHDSANQTTFAIVAQLLKYGVPKSEIIKNIYHNYSYDRMRLMGYVLYKKLKILPEHKFGYITLTQQELTQFNFQFGDHENFVNLPLSIKGIEISAMFMEREDFIRVSLRSSGYVDVGKVAKLYLEGGGHHNAAGGNLPKPMDSAVNHFLTNILPKISINV